MLKSTLRLSLALTIMLLLGAAAHAGGGGDTTFANVVTQLTNWATGGLGQTISLSAVIIGGIVSVVRSNPMPILSGIAFAMILNFTPAIVTNLLTGTL